MRIVAFSDTHRQHALLTPHMMEGDVLVFAGDMCGSHYHSKAQVENFVEWLLRLDYKHKIVVAGNHDFAMEDRDNDILFNYSTIHYLHDDSVTIDGIKFYGSPYQPWFCDWAFNARRGKEIAQIWDKIPDDTNVLVTHGPSSLQLDMTAGGEYVGCADLANKMRHLKQLKLHIFGHIHESAGWGVDSGIDLYNVSVCNERNRLVRYPTVIDI